MIPKPEISLGPEDEGHPLTAKVFLASLKENASFHQIRDCRHPLGVYGLSVGRICEKVSKCADKLESYWTESLLTQDIVREEIIDYFELALYAAAEHVDDVERIAYTFFKTDREAAKDRNVRLLNTAIKPLRDEIASFTNTIKHSHGRIRLFETKFKHDGREITLIGFFIEGFKDGKACPSPILHGGDKVILSITSFLWSVLTFVALVSVELSKFLQRLDAVNENLNKTIDAKIFRDASLKLTRLPLYTFDEDHPFLRVKWIITMDDAMLAKTESVIYGSIRNKWSKAEEGKFDGWQLRYAGDDITRSFHLALPKKMAIQHWE